MGRRLHFGRHLSHRRDFSSSSDIKNNSHWTRQHSVHCKDRSMKGVQKEGREEMEGQKKWVEVENEMEGKNWMEKN